MSSYSNLVVGGGPVKQNDQIVQHKYVKYLDNTSQTLATASTSFLLAPFHLLITPNSSSNSIMVQFNTSMSYGLNGTRLTTRLKRTINGTVDYPVDKTGNSSQPYYYGWAYTGRSYWRPAEYYYVDKTHNTTSEIKYEIEYAEITNSSAAYLGHRYMPVWLSATEIKQ
jgi:hypothetical protein